MTFLKKKIKGLKKRLSCLKYGMFYLRNADFKIPDHLEINGSKTLFRFKDLSEEEFTMICIEDCYRLMYLKKKLKFVKTIVDVGANQGVFLIAARQLFPNATINGYEPNYSLSGTLKFNAEQVKAGAYFEAVMKHDCKVKLNFAGSDLATTASESTEGAVTGSSLATVIKRNGAIDILKLDCEGAEWGLLEDTESWKQIRSLTMEYHLWGKEGSKVEDLFQLLKVINFISVHHTIYNTQQGLIVALNNSIP